MHVTCISSYLYNTTTQRYRDTAPKHVYISCVYHARVYAYGYAPDMTHATLRRQDKLLRLHPRNQVKNGLIGNAKVFATGNASPLSCVARTLFSVVDALASPSSAAVPYACTGGSNGARR